MKMARIHLKVFIAMTFFALPCCGESEESMESISLEYIYSKEHGGLVLVNKSLSSTQTTRHPPKDADKGKVKTKGAATLNDFGTIDLKQLISNHEDFPASYVSVNEMPSSCTDLESCRAMLMERRRIEYDFYVLPDGKILEGVGNGYVKDRGTMLVGFPKSSTELPTQEAMEAFAFLLRMQIASGKLMEDSYSMFNFSLPAGSIRWKSAYANVYDSSLSVATLKVYGDVQFLAREDWGAVGRLRRLNGTNEKASVVEILLTKSTSSTQEDCLIEVRRLQREQITRFSDVFSNFIICGDGRIYEGLGWDLSRKGKTVYFDLLVDNTGPWSQVLAAFALKLREGIRLGKISDDFDIVTPHDISEDLSKKLNSTGSVAKSIGKRSTVLILHHNGTQGGNSSQDNSNEVIHTLTHPIATVRFIQTDMVCDEPRNCVPYRKFLDGEELRSLEKLSSNFYFTNDSVVYKGLGWRWSYRKDEVTFEFPTMVPYSLPTNQSMLSSMLMIREGVVNGYLKTDYKTKLAKDSSVEFGKMVRFWDERIRG